MAINAFEGGRRIIALLQVLLVLGCVAALLLYHPYTDVTIQTFWPNGDWTISPTNCAASADHEEYGTTVDIGNGRTGSVNLCFRASRADNGEMLIPYERTSNNRYSMDAAFSGNVEDYIHDRMMNLALSPSLQQQLRDDIDHKWWEAFWDNFKDVVLAALIGCAIIWIMGFVIGWIVRGFAGIPSGMDRRAE